MPTNIQITSRNCWTRFSINPNGDGSGKVNFTVNADDALSYTMSFGNGQNKAEPSGSFFNCLCKNG